MSAPAPFVGETIQVSMVTSDLHRGLDDLVGLGIGPFQVFRIGPDNCVGQTYRGEPAEWSLLAAFTMAGSMMWEVIQPLEGPSVYTEFLEAGREGLHHVAVDCEGIPLEERAAELERRGYECIMSASAFDGDVPFGYFHNGDSAAPVVEIFQFPEGFAPQPDEWYPAPPADAG